MIKSSMCFSRILKMFLMFIVFMLLKEVSAQDKLYSGNVIQLGGYVEEKLNLSLNNGILMQDVDRLIEPFKNRNETWQWQTEFWGKWITSAILAYRYQPSKELKRDIDYAIKEILKTQSSDGYIGNYALSHRLQQWDIWGRKYTLLGLLDYYDLTGDNGSLNAAKRTADFLLKELAQDDGIIVTKGNHRGMAASSILEPMARLYTRTKDIKYLNFAEEIVRQWETEEGPQLISKAHLDVSKRFPVPEDNWYGWQQGQKAYEMMSCYEGLLELYRITGKSLYKDAVVKTWENINNTEINVAGSGASIEAWFGGKALQTFPIKHYQETCVTVTWIKFSHQLLKLTGAAKYAEAIEKAYYNSLLGSMYPDGSSWTQYTPLSGQRLPGVDQCGMGLNCCIANGPRGLFIFPETVVMNDNKGFHINLFNSGSYKVNAPSGQEIILSQKTDFPVSGEINMDVNLIKSERFIVNIRIPAWSKKNTLKINGEAIANLIPGEYVALNRLWENGDKIELLLDMRGQLEKVDQQIQYLAIRRGPLLLARDSRLDNEVDFATNIRPLLNKDGFVELKLKALNNNNIWMQFEAVVEKELNAGNNTEAKLSLINYSSAGYRADMPFFKVWMPQLYDPWGKVNFTLQGPADSKIEIK